MYSLSYQSEGEVPAKGRFPKVITQANAGDNPRIASRLQPCQDM